MDQVLCLHETQVSGGLQAVLWNNVFLRKVQQSFLYFVWSNLCLMYLIIFESFVLVPFIGAHHSESAKAY